MANPELDNYVTPAAAPRLSIINRSAVKAYALKVSVEKRAGKFTRVSGEFLDDVEAQLEAVIRALAGSVTEDSVVIPDKDADWFVNSRTLRCVEEKLNIAARKIISGKVRRHPSVGVTLK